MLNLSDSIEKGLDYQIRKRDENGGFPAVKATDQAGVWTTAEAITVISNLRPSVGSEFIGKSLSYILNRQCPGEGWYLIGRPPSSTMSTSDALVALLEAKNRNLIPESIIEKADLVIEQGFKWLENSQNSDGGWGIEHNPSSEEGKSRIYSTYYTLRALHKRDIEFSSAIEGGINYILDCQNQNNGGWGFEKGSEVNISSTSRAIQLLVQVGRFAVDSPPVNRGINYLLQLRDHSSEECASEELITRSEGLLRIDNYTCYDLLNGLLCCRWSEIKILQLIQWFLITQHGEGYWNLRCLCRDKVWDASSWVTSETLLVLTKAKNLFKEDPDFILHCFFSEFPKNINQDQAIERLKNKGFTYFESLYDLTPQIVLDAFLDEIVNIPLIESINFAINYIIVEASSQQKERNSLSWKMIASSSNDLAIKVKTYSYAADLTMEKEEKELLISKKELFEILLQAKNGQIDIDSLGKFLGKLKTITDDQEITALMPLITHIFECLNFEKETDPTITSIRVGNALITIRQLEDIVKESSYIANLIGPEFLSFLQSRINDGILKLKERVKSFVNTEIKGSYEENKANTLRCFINVLGLPVENLTVNINETEYFRVSVSERHIAVVGTAGAEVLFTLIPLKRGRIRIPLNISYEDLNGERHEVKTEHEIIVNRGSKPQRHVKFQDIPNPYSYGPGVFSNKMFFGREDKLREMVNSIQSTPQPYAVVGQRRIGKTSFLRALKVRLEGKGIICVFIDLEMINPKTPILFLDRLNEQVLVELSESTFKEKVPQKTLFNRIGEALSMIKEIEILKAFKLNIDKPVLEEEQIAFKRTEAVMKTYNTILEENEYRCVIMMDEIGELSKYEGYDKLLGFLRGLIQLLSRFSFIVAGPDILFELTSHENPFFNIFQKVHLHGLMQDEVKALMTKPIPQVEYEEEVFSFIYETTGGNPFYVQAICKYLVSGLNRERRYNITVADATNVIDILVDELDDQSRFQWEDTTAFEHLILASISNFRWLCDSSQIIDNIRINIKEQLGEQYFPTEITGSFHRLQEKGYVIKNGTNYQITDEIFRRWINVHHPLLNVIKEELRIQGDIQK